MHDPRLRADGTLFDALRRVGVGAPRPFARDDLDQKRERIAAPCDA